MGPEVLDNIVKSDDDILDAAIQENANHVCASSEDAQVVVASDKELARQTEYVLNQMVQLQLAKDEASVFPETNASKLADINREYDEHQVLLVKLIAMKDSRDVPDNHG